MILTNANFKSRHLLVVKLSGFKRKTFECPAAQAVVTEAERPPSDMAGNSSASVQDHKGG